MNSHHGSAPLRSCDVYSEQIHLLVDRELGPAEEALVEAHLQECPRCQVLVARIERMSSVLKEWDGETNDHVPPAQRLQHTVLARVAEQSVQRRRAGQRLSLMHYATAACVLVGLGLGLWFGLAEIADERLAGPALVANLEPWPADTRLDEGLDLPSLAGAPVPSVPPLLSAEPDPRLPAMASQMPAAWDPKVVLDDDSVARIAFLAAHQRGVEAFSRAVGAPSMRLRLPGHGGHRFVTISAYTLLHDKGWLVEFRDAAITPSSTVESNGAARPTTVETDMTAAQMLAPMPGVTEHLRTITVRVPRMELPEPKPKGAASSRRPPTLIKVWGVRAPQEAPLASGPLGSRKPHSFLDPLEAEGNGWLKLAEGRDAGEVVALVEGTTEPIYIPAGQILSGGKADRVVAQPIWLPASRTKKPYLIPCRVVENYPDGNARDVPRLTPLIAGPTIRALLAAGATQAEVKAAAARQIATLYPNGSLEPWSHWSLLYMYGDKGPSNLARLRRDSSVWRGEAGFVVTDKDGRFLGSEILRFQGAAAEELLTRLMLSYWTEGSLRIRSKSKDAFAEPATGLPHVFDPLVQYRAHFRKPAGFVQPEGARVSSLHVPTAGLHLHALEVGGQPAAVSSLRSAP